MNRKLIFFFFLQVLQNAPDDILVVASSTLCNLLLEFSPSKEVSVTKAQYNVAGVGNPLIAGMQISDCVPAVLTIHQKFFP